MTANYYLHVHPGLPATTGLLDADTPVLLSLLDTSQPLRPRDRGPQSGHRASCVNADRDSRSPSLPS